MQGVSIVICTFQRWEILLEVLEVLIPKISNNFELLIINNDLNTGAPSEILTLVRQHSNIKYLVEEAKGLSHARNRGVREAKNDWLLFLDDDAKINEDIFEKAQYHVQKDEDFVIGGVYLPWYRYGQPRWFKDSYGSNKPAKSGFYKLEVNQEISGGVMLIKKIVFELAGVFDPNLGMKGKKIGYGEETEWQNRVRQNGIDIFIDTDIIIHHVVQDYKLKVQWFLDSKKALGRDMFYFKKQPVAKVILAPFIAFAFLLINSFRNSFKLLSKNYYLENWKIDSFSKPVKWMSFFKEALKLRS